MSKYTQDNRLIQIDSPLGKDFLLVERLRSTEGISKLFSYEVEVLVDPAKPVIKPTDILGQGVTITVENVAKTDGRSFCGMVSEIQNRGTAADFRQYTLTVVPRAWLLTLGRNSRIFQDKSVPQILQEVLKDLNPTYKLNRDYNNRNYCVQYRESDWQFATRLMEEDGIFFYFKHDNGIDTLIVGDNAQAHVECPNGAKFDFQDWRSLRSGHLDKDHRAWTIGNHFQAGKITFWDNNFQLPGQRLEYEQVSSYNKIRNDKVEFYDYPGNYAKRFDGIEKGGGEKPSDLSKVTDEKQVIAKLAMESLNSRFAVSEGKSAYFYLIAGHKFTLEKHFQNELNREYMLTSVQHEILQIPSYRSRGVDKDEEEILNSNTFECIPVGGNDATTFRPERTLGKPVLGLQTAVVVGGAEKIVTDKYGRVKVQFHWDRQGKNDTNSSCWVRVGQAWAGNKWGSMFIPRVGMEVIVQFIESDPDQPIITGCVYNPANMPPYTLPDEKTKSTIKTNTVDGSGFNEIRFEDKAGSEQIFIHGQKDVDIKVLNDVKESIDNDHHITIKNNEYQKINGDRHVSITGNDMKKVSGSISRQAAGDIQEKTTGKYAMDAMSEIHLKAAMKAVIEAGMQLTIKAGSGYVDIGPSGVTISGPMVLINSGGAAGTGSGSSPTSPTDPKDADDAQAGQTTQAPAPPSPPSSSGYSPAAAQMASASASGTPLAGAAAGGPSAPPSQQTSPGGAKGGVSSSGKSGGSGGAAAGAASAAKSEASSGASSGKGGGSGAGSGGGAQKTGTGPTKSGASSSSAKGDAAAGAASSGKGGAGAADEAIKGADQKMKAAEQKLNDAQQQVKSAEQKLKDAEQQAKNAEQQLKSAGEQQLKSAEDAINKYKDPKGW